LIEDSYSRETATINQKYNEQIEALRQRAEKEVALREVIAEQIQVLEQKRAMELADVYTKYADKTIAETKRIADAKKKADDEAYKAQYDAINKETQLQQLLIGNMSVNAKKKEELSLQAEKERLQKIYDLNVKAGKDITSLEMRTIQEQMKKADQEIKKAQKPQDVYDDPVNLFVAKFLGTPPINVFEGKVKGGKIYIGNDAVGDAANVSDQDVWIGIRPEGFILDENGPLHCNMERVEVMGRDVSIVSTNPSSANVTVRSIISSDIKVDRTKTDVRFSVKPHKICIFNKDTEERIHI
jgi:hypothetical protein